ncbi:MAG TPA: hypothetical protein VJ810_40405, partial [Blastocatellia bacterium]|nr:hypothetical protein [Blastocatellia bacterium]
STARVSKRLTDEPPACLRARYCARKATFEVYKEEAKRAKRAKVAKNHFLLLLPFLPFWLPL